MNKNKINIAIFGGTGHIAKGLIKSFSAYEDFSIEAFSRNPLNMDAFFRDENIRASAKSYDIFFEGSYHVIVNCVGIGEPSRLQYGYIEQLQITEKYDNQILEYLSQHPQTIYINLSSGAVFNSQFLHPIDDTTGALYMIGAPRSSEYYGISKLYSEYKHRTLSENFIIDIRIFGYFSEYIHLDSGFFLADIARAIKYGDNLKVSHDEIWRDYISYKELHHFILGIIARPQNIACDIYSLSPISKTELLTLIGKEFHLQYSYKKSTSINPTGVKPCYYSISKKAEQCFGYHPERTSEQVILDQLSIILS